MARTVKVKWGTGLSVTARLAAPARPSAPAVLLAHGAGAGQDHPFMVDLREGLAAAGHAVMTFNYPYAEAGRRSPDRPSVLTECHRAAAAALRRRYGQIVLAGKSMGGRIASHVAAGGEPCIGLVFYGYPLVAAGKREPRDTAHLDGLGVPMLFLSGSRDPLGPLDFLRPLVGRLPGATLVVVEDGDHSFRVRSGRSAAGVMDLLVAGTVSAIRDWL
jgi:predicted alpha/beta-hydrolase family hydrolase